MKRKSDRATGEDEQYASVETADGDTVIYDRANEHAWVQSSYTVEIEA